MAMIINGAARVAQTAGDITGLKDLHDRKYCKGSAKALASAAAVTALVLSTLKMMQSGDLDTAALQECLDTCTAPFRTVASPSVNSTVEQDCMSFCEAVGDETNALMKALFAGLFFS